jgi:hypothetical protein
MNTAKNIYFWMIFSFILMAASETHAITENYTLDNVILDDNTQMTGTFSWTFDAGDFENGVGQFTSLAIPWTSHNQDDLDAVFDIGNSIEITLEGSVHDDGVDITLFLLQPLTPTTSSSIDLVRSKYEIGGNGFHDGLFLSGSISPIIAADNCITAPNPDQDDSDGDLCGNHCDADYNQDGVVSISDFGIFRTCFSGDFQGICDHAPEILDGAISIQDFGIFRQQFAAGVPGPGQSAACDGQL